MQQKEHMLKCANLLLKKNLLSYIFKKSLYSTYGSFLVINFCKSGKTYAHPVDVD